MLGKWNPYRVMERTFEDLFGRDLFARPFWDDRNEVVGGWKPAVNVYEDKENLYVEAQLPGIDMKDVKLSVTDHQMEIHGERKVEHEENKDGYHFREARYGTFARSFALPSYVAPDKAKAGYERGVLTISVPKLEEGKPKVIPIEAK